MYLHEKPFGWTDNGKCEQCNEYIKLCCKLYRETMTVGLLSDDTWEVSQWISIRSRTLKAAASFCLHHEGCLGYDLMCFY